MRPVLTVFLFLLSSALAAPPPRNYLHYSYTGGGPAGWCQSVTAEASPAASAPPYTTFIGDTHEYRVAQIAADATGNTYVAGSRIVTAPNSSASQLSDIFVTKLDPSGNILFTATLSGKGDDQLHALAIDAAGNLYLAGNTSSSNFPLRDALQTKPGPGSGFLVKLSPDGSGLIYSTYFGGTLGPSYVNAVAVDSAGNVYLTGSTYASDFPLTPGLPAGRVGFGLPFVSGAFITKLSAAGDRILYSGLLVGGTVACGAGSSCFLSSRNTAGIGIGLDAAGNAVVAGNTNTTDLPTTPGSLLGQGIGAFVAKVNAAGSALVYLTYIGAANYVIAPFANPGNIVNALAVDAAGDAYLAGYTTDPKFPATPGAFQPVFSGPANPPPYPAPPSDAFVAKLSPDGASMRWATFVGGAGDDSAQSIALDPSGNSWITGTTSSPQFPNAQGWSQGGDFLIGLDPSGSSLVYSARFPDGGVSQAVAVDASGLVRVAGRTGIVSAIAPDRPASTQVFGIADAAAGPVSGLVAPGELISIYGPHIGPSTPVSAAPDSAGFFPKSLAGVQVFFNDTALPVLYVSDAQVNAVAPFSLSGRDAASIHLSINGAASADYPVAVIPTAPEIFRNSDGTAAAVNEDGTINATDHPAKLGSIVSIWATGTGAIAAADGQIAVSAQNYFCCEAQVQSQPADVLYAGASPGIVAGVTQINLRLPALPYSSPGQVTVTISARGRTSAQAQIYVTP